MRADCANLIIRLTFFCTKRQCLVQMCRFFRFQAFNHNSISWLRYLSSESLGWDATLNRNLDRGPPPGHSLARGLVFASKVNF